MKEYKIKEMFLTMQGEGRAAGTLAVFVRLVGCNLWSGYDEDRRRDAKRAGAECPLWCDTDFTKEGAFSMTAHEVGHAARQLTERGRLVVVTGGEPLLQIDDDFVAALKEKQFAVNVETNGTVSLSKFKSNPPDWIVCSPKLPEERLNLERCTELKTVVPDYTPGMYPRLLETARHVYVQPEDGPRKESAVEECFNLIKQNPGWKISAQTHKFLGLE